MVRADRPLDLPHVGLQIFENGDRRTYGNVLRRPRALPDRRAHGTRPSTSSAAGRRTRALLPLARLPRAASRVGPHSAAAPASSCARRRVTAGATRTCRCRGRRATTRGLSRQALVRRPLEPRDHLQARGGHRHALARALGVAAGRRRGRRADHRRLRDTGELDKTYVLFTSDNGYMQGEHRIPQGKMLPYDPSTHLPLLIRGPGIPRGRRTKALWATSTWRHDHAGHPRGPSRPLDGRSFLPFARNVRLAACGRSCTRRPVRARRAHEYPRGRRGGTAAAGAGLERGPHHALALRRLQGRPARAVRPERPVGDELVVA